MSSSSCTGGDSKGPGLRIDTGQKWGPSPKCGHVESRQGQTGFRWAGEKLLADLHVVDAFGLRVHHEEAVIEVLFGPPPTGQGQALQKQRQLHLQWTTTEKPLRQLGPPPPPPPTPHPTHQTGSSKETLTVA